MSETRKDLYEKGVKIRLCLTGDDAPRMARNVFAEIDK